MDVCSSGDLLAQILEVFFSGLADSFLLCTLKYLISAAGMPGLHNFGQGFLSCLCKVPQLLFEVPFINYSSMNSGEVCLGHILSLVGKNW